MKYSYICMTVLLKISILLCFENYRKCRLSLSHLLIEIEINKGGSISRYVICSQSYMPKKKQSTEKVETVEIVLPKSCCVTLEIKKTDKIHVILVECMLTKSLFVIFMVLSILKYFFILRINIIYT